MCRWVYSAVLYSIILFILPLMILVILNYKLVRALQDGKHQWRHLRLQQKKEQSLTIIPLCIVLVFFLCDAPNLLIQAILAFKPDILHLHSSVVFIVTANLMLVINSAANFVIYCFLGRRFRSHLSALCCCKWSLKTAPSISR